MNISIIGTGYVGLVTGACFAEMGNQVTCVDIDQQKIDGLKEGRLPIYEPGLEEMVLENHREGRISFTTDLATAASSADIHFIAVGTPPGEDGSADLQYVLAVARDLGRLMQQPHNIVVDKSTVPVGTADKVSAVIQQELTKRNSDITFDVVSNPEFLKEGAAIDDFLHPDRVVIGADSESAGKVMHELYAAFTRNHDRIILMGLRDAEMTKYAANAMLATKISFMNELALLCEELGVDVESVRTGIGSDQRIGYHFIYPGAGYGGSCFPKDVKALLGMARECGVDALLLDAVERRNEQQKQRLAEKIKGHFGADLTGRRIALWGLAFKPGTDDMREAPSLVLIDELIKSGATVCAYDPVATKCARAELPPQWLENHSITFAEHQNEVFAGADALVLVTEWKPFRNPDFESIAELMPGRVIFDGRNQYNPEQLRRLGFIYYGIGRGEVK